MTEYKLYPNLPSAPPENPQVVYHLRIIQAKQRRLKNKEQMFKKKYEKYNKILNQNFAFCTGFNLLTPIFMLPYIIMDLPIFMW